MKVILNNVIGAGSEEAAIRDGYFVKKPGGRLEITQKALVAFEAAQIKLERLAGLIKTGLEVGASVEDGVVDAGIFEEGRKNPNWRNEFVALGGVAKDILDGTDKKFSRRIRVFDTGDKQNGTRLAPTDGQPLAPREEAKG